jgi:hypothetical protein
MAATEAPSGTPSIRSTTPGTKDGSTRGRPMPSIRDAVLSAARPRYDGRKAEFSGSTTHSRVDVPRSRRYRPNVAAVPPVPAPTTIQDGVLCGSRAIWASVDSAMLLLPRQSVARSA